MSNVISIAFDHLNSPMPCKLSWLRIVFTSWGNITWLHREPGSFIIGLLISKTACNCYGTSGVFFSKCISETSISISGPGRIMISCAPWYTHMYQLWPTIRDSLSTFISINVVRTSTYGMSMNQTWWYYSSSSWVHTLNGLLCYMIIRFKACILWHWRRYFGHKVNNLFTPSEMVDG